MLQFDSCVINIIAGELGITSEDTDSSASASASTNTSNLSNLKSIDHPKIINSVFKSSTNNTNMIKLSIENGIVGIINHDVVIVIDRSGSMQVDVEAKRL